MSNTASSDAKADLADQLRQSVADAYSFVRGQEAADSLAATTFEELLDKQIVRIEGAGTDIRPNVLDRIQKVKTDIVAVATTLKSLPDSYFQETPPEEAAVTDPDVDE